jgi:cardiolipin synthase A/B
MAQIDMTSHFRVEVERHWKSLSSGLMSVLVLACVSACSTQPAGARVPSDGRMDSNLGSGIVPTELLVEPQAGSRPLVRVIDRAQTRIFIEIYILTDASVIRALERAAAQGVAVYVMLEHRPLGLGVQPDRMMDRLRAAGILVKWTRPGFQLTHAKFVVVDDRLAVISSANFSRSAFRQNRDFLVFDDRQADVLAISRLFRADWDRLPASFQNLNLLVSPVNARLKLQMLIARAHRTIDVYAEEIADTRLERRLGAAARRGIRVRVILAWGGSPAAVAALARQGVQVRELRSPYIHAKVVSVDGKEAYVGSENLSAASLDRNRELGILLRGPAVRRLKTVFATDWGRGSAPTR